MSRLMSVTVIPAQLGWFVVQVSKDSSGQPRLDERAILAWQIEIWSDRQSHTTDPPCPITTAGLHHPRERVNQWAVKCPNGTYDILGQPKSGMDAKACMDHLLNFSDSKAPKPKRQRFARILTGINLLLTGIRLRVSRIPNPWK
jgi:hypothetical protein